MSEFHPSYPVEQLLHWAASKPDATWLIQPGQGDLRRWSWAEAADQVRRMAAALQARGWPQGSRVAIAGLNTAHWMLADLAIQMAGLVPVGLFPRQISRNAVWILEHCEAVAIFMGPMTGADLLQSLPDGLFKIGLPYLGAPAGDASWDDLVAAHAPLASYQPPSPDTLATLVYTSGTTGNPKGVMLSFGNLVFSSAAFRATLPVQPDERLFSYLPLAHLLERTAVEMASLYWGSEVFFLERIEKMAEQLPEASPTRFVAVPLVLARMQAGYTMRMPEAQLRRLVNRRWIGGLLQRRLVSRIGLGNARVVLSSGAQVPRSTLEFFRDVFDIDIYECYGQSEALYCSMNRPGHARIGSVGRPFPDANLRLSGEGEIQVRHPGVMMGYYKDPEATAEVFTEDGWLRTGDKGEFDADGFLYITGRVKDIFKTAKGKYVAPAPIEGAMAGNDDLEQLCLIGINLTQPVLVASLSPQALGKPRAAVEARLLADMERVNARLEDHEQIAKVLLVKDHWGIENGLMTPTLKIRRGEVEARYADVIAREAQRREALVAWV